MSPPINAGTPNSSSYYPYTDPPAGTALSSKTWSKNKNLPKLFEPIKVGSVEFKNRIWVAPMCQYSASENGTPTDWHLVHLGSFAVRGAGVVMFEASSVLPNGRISPQDLGIWSDSQVPAYARIVDFIKSQGSVAAIQLAHGGRKASTHAPWVRGNLMYPDDNEEGPHIKALAEENVGGWPKDVWGPTAESFEKGEYADPNEMTLDDIEAFKKAWGESVKRSIKAGFTLIEIHAAHGYLLHEFLSPFSNKRTDKYGGSLENRMRLPLEVVALSRALLPTSSHVLAIRISATDWHKAGEKSSSTGEYISWGIEQSKVFLAEAIKNGIDIMDVSSGGNDVDQDIKIGPGYQAPFAKKLRESLTDENRIPISSVGLITSGKQAEKLVQEGYADVISVAREFLRDADLVLNWAHELNAVVSVPVQYQRAYTRMYKKEEPEDHQVAHQTLVQKN